jgi:uncharacterized protein
MTDKATADPRRIDMRSLARQGAELQGSVAQDKLPRLAQSVERPDGAAPAALAPTLAHWQARGELKPVAGGPPQVWLHLQAQTEVQLVCQRCLQRMAVPLQAARSFLFVDNEAQAAVLDEELEDDVLALQQRLNLLELVEDELILALPIVPRHEVCALPAVLADSDLADAAVPASNPFAVLAALKRPPRPS